MKRGTLVLLIAIAGTFYLSLNSSNRGEVVPREKLSPIINSEYQEVRPLISPDGKTLYFSRRYHPDNIGGARDFQDTWVSNLMDGAWSPPRNLGKPLNNKKTNTLCSITGDGQYALLLDSYKGVKSPLTQAFNSPAGWGPPKELVIQDFVNLSSFYDFYYHEPSGVLLMAIDNGRGNGEQDLFASFKQEDGSYSIPRNLGNTINSKKADFAPFLAADGKTLFFASYGHRGHGGSDLFVAQRLDDSWKRWSEPKNLGLGINSKQDENYLSVTGDFSLIYFESYTKGSKEKDIYRAPLPRQFHPQYLMPGEAVIAEKTVTTEAKPKPQQHVPLSSSLATRQYLQDGQIKSRVLNNTYYPSNSYQLTPECKAQLTEISRIMHGTPTMDAELKGHADNWGPGQVNLRISFLRAQAAAHFLIDQGISAGRLQVTGAGEAFPLASNDDEQDGRELNRRVEITLINAAGVDRD